MNLINLFMPFGLVTEIVLIGVAGVIFLAFMIIIIIARMYKKVPQGKALVRTGFGATKVSFTGMMVWPVIHKLEIMDISLKSIEVVRMGKDGLICQDNMRADIKVVFFVRVNQTGEAVKEVSQKIGCERASHIDTLITLFDAKFSEALKTVGKQFDFVELYNSRERFKKEILNVIGTDLNGYELDDAAIDYLEQTPIEFLRDDNILDSEGIKKIADLTAVQHIEANRIRKDEEKTIVKQNVEAQEAILELNKQLAEKEEKQKREIANIKAREGAEIEKVNAEEKLKSENARITAEEEIGIAEENKQRLIIVAQKSKERTEAVETERVEKDKQLEVTEREKVVTLAQIEKEKSVEEERKNIQDVIKERVIVEKAVVVEEELIKDTRAFAEADRNKKVAMTDAEKEAEQLLIKKVKSADADKLAAEIDAKKRVIEAEAQMEAAIKESEAKKTIADAIAAEESALGKSEAQVMEAKALAKEKEGSAEASVLEKLAQAEARAIEMKATANEQAGIKEANVLEQKALAEAKGIEAKGGADARAIEDKAEAMKKLDGVGKEHEEFKLKLNKELQVDLAEIDIQRAIAEAQASVIAEALKSANIDIVGGEQEFFNKIISSITQGKRVDRMISNSDVLTEVKANLLSGEGGNVMEKVREIIKATGVGSEDIKNLSIAALIMKLSDNTKDASLQKSLTNLLNTVWSAGVANQPASLLGL